MTSALNERIDWMRRGDRAKLYYGVGILSCLVAWIVDARFGAFVAAEVLLGLAAAFLLMRFLRELRPDRMSTPPELRFIERKPRS